MLSFCDHFKFSTNCYTILILERFWIEFSLFDPNFDFFISGGIFLFQNRYFLTINNVISTCSSTVTHLNFFFYPQYSSEGRRLFVFFCWVNNLNNGLFPDFLSFFDRNDARGKLLILFCWQIVECGIVLKSKFHLFLLSEG